MNDLRKQPFYPKLKPDFASKLPDLINQSKEAYMYSRIEFAAYLFAGGLALLNIKAFFSDNFGFREFIMILIGGIAIIGANNITKEPEDRFKKTCEKIKRRLVIKICDCPGYCTCKDEFAAYMKKRDVDLLL